jgi:hypothetical protein
MKTWVKVAAGGLLSLAIQCGRLVAAPNVSNTTNEGSVLVFPYIDVSEHKDTIIRLQNNYDDIAYVQCYWKNGSKFSNGFGFRLTSGQPISFTAKTGNGIAPPFPQTAGRLAVFPKFQVYDRGELKCWAVNDTYSQQVYWNHLVGSATVFDYAAQAAWEYSPWHFRALAKTGEPGKTLSEGAPVGKAGVIRLNGEEYDACPAYLLGHFSPTDPASQAEMVGVVADGSLKDGRTKLVVATCQQDFRQDKKLSYTKLRFDLWNEDEVRFGQPFHCMNSWAEVYLGSGPYGVDEGADLFDSETLATSVARFRVEGVESKACRPYLPKGARPVPAGLIGILIRSIDVPNDSDQAMPPVAATTIIPMHTVGTSKAASTDAILWDPGPRN